MGDQGSADAATLRFRQHVQRIELAAVPRYAIADRTARHEPDHVARELRDQHRVIVVPALQDALPEGHALGLAEPEQHLVGQHAEIGRLPAAQLNPGDGLRITRSRRADVQSVHAIAPTLKPGVPSHDLRRESRSRGGAMTIPGR
jgi:hypothetical protein